MDSNLRKKAESLINIYQQVAKDFRWKNSSSINTLIALSYVTKDKAYDRKEIERVNDYIKKNLGSFSSFRQRSILYSALLLVNSPDPETKLDILLAYDEKLKENGFRSYTYRPVTAYTLFLNCEPRKADIRIAKAYEIFTEMKKHHPWLTSGDDYAVSILLAASDKPVQSIIAKMEELYKELHECGFSRGNGLQFLSHILSLSEENSKAKAARCRILYDFFGQNKLKVYANNYGTLGLLTLLEDKSQRAAREVLGMSEVLREDRNIRWLGKETIFLTAASLVSCTMLESLKNSNDVIYTNAFVTIEALIAAQNAAMIGAACAATAASSGS
ncbi:MAG: DUF4003 domain-containing protein [Candidatus Dehalobacter alkaniphilus]|nr:DUF4003 domain-containing protein [Dehalobacter sp.]